MTMAHIRPCLKKLGIGLVCQNGEEINPRTITKRNIGL